jgi:hypothetical protein
MTTGRRKRERDHRRDIETPDNLNPAGGRGIDGDGRGEVDGGNGGEEE